MPGQVPGDPKSPKPKSNERPRNVQFAAYVEDYVSSPETGKARPLPSTTADNNGTNVNGSRSTNTNGATNADISNRHANATPKTASAADYEPTKDTQPSSFPSVGPPPSNINSYGGGQWHTSVDPSQSLNWPGGQLHAGPPWASSYNLAPPGPHFHAPWAPPHHLVNSAAYPVFAPPSPYPYQPGAVPVGQQGYVVAQQPPVIPQPMPGQPQQHVLINGQAYPVGHAYPPPGMCGMPPGVAGPGMMTGGGSTPIITGNNGNPPPPPPPPDVSGLGKTPGEETLRQLQFAHANKLFEPQDFKPADDDPSRFYYVREVDGNWTQRNRFTIDHMGDCRWYVTDEGWFYAVRLPD